MDTNPAIDKERQALIAIRRLRRQLEQLEYSRREPIAIVGLSCRFPAAPDAKAYWRLLDNGLDGTREVPADRWDVDTYFDPDPDTPGKIYSRRAGYIEGIDGFDAGFFGISPREAEFMDPQQRLLLQQAWCALEDAGIAAADVQGARGGVFMGLTASDYGMMILEAGIDVGPHYITGNTLNVAVGRISYVLRLQGPAMAIDTACSSSLVAVHQACASLRSGESDFALAGGVNLIITPQSTIATCRARMLSADGHCKTFDAAADGFARGEGCGVVVLKRLSDALRDGDRIRAVIRGSALNHDGRSSGLTVPNGPAQQSVIADALRMAGLQGREVQYLETHGTGTPLGDPIEVQAAAAVLGVERDQKQPLLLGAVKTNIGHLEAASGVASLIKVVLAIEHGRVPASLHLSAPNPHIPWDELAVRVPTQSEPWPNGQKRRIAGVSSFGFSGTNAHVLVEEAPQRAEEAASAQQSSALEAAPEPPYRLLVLSARASRALEQLAADYGTWLDRDPAIDIADLCYTANTGRTHFEQRAALVFDAPAQLREQLGALASGGKARGLVATGSKPGRAKPRIAFLFSGQGGQYSGMGRALYDSQPVFRAQFDRCAAEFARLREDAPRLQDVAFDEALQKLLVETGYIQPVLYSLQVSLAALWRSWGVVPSAVSGHSAGEYAAACAAGVFGVEDGLRLIVERARLMQTLPAGGAMLTVTAPAQTVEAALAGDDFTCVSAYHGLNTIISGPSERVDALMAEFEKQDLYCTKLPHLHAFHSRHVEPILDAFEDYAGGVQYASPARKLVSTLTGSTVEALDAKHWRDHAREPVRFAAAVQTLFETVGCDAVVEVGPQAELMWLAQMCYRPEHEVLWTSSLAKGRNALEQMLTAAAQLHVQGAVLDFRALEGEALKRRSKLSAPTYPFQRSRYWVEIPASARVLPGVALQDCVYRVAWEQKDAAAAPRRAGTAPGWLILADEGEVGSAVVRELEARGERCVRLDPAVAQTLSAEMLGERLQAAFGAPPRMVLHLASLEGAPAQSIEELRGAQVYGVESALKLAQALIACDYRGQLWLVTRGVKHVLDADVPQPAQSPLWGLGKAIGMERPQMWGGLVDLPLAAGASSAARALIEACEAEDYEDQVAVRDGRRFVARLVRDQQLTAAALQLDPDASYLITGGLGGIGLEAARRFADRGARHVVLNSRRAASQAAQAAIAELGQRGCTVTVILADVAQEDEVRRLFDEIEQRALPPLKGILHAAGVESIVALEKVEREDLYTTLGPKVFGAWLLDRIVAERGYALSFFVCTASIASVWGSAMQASYAAANAFLDGLCEARAARGVPGTAVSFGPWRQTTGMSTEEALAWLRSRGIRAFGPSFALDGMEAAVAAGWAGMTLANIDWEKFAAVAQVQRPRPLIARLAEAHKPQTGEEASNQAAAALARLRAAPESERVQLIAATIRQEVAQVLKIAPEALDKDVALLELGMDSLMAVELINRLGKALAGTGFSPSLLQGYPSVTLLAQAIAGGIENLAHGAGNATEGEPAPASPATPTASSAQAVVEVHYQTKDARRYAYRRYREGDRAQAIASFEQSFGRDAAHMLEKFFDWKYVHNPLTPEGDSVLDLLEHEGRIVGMNGGTRARFKIDDMTAPGVWSSDSHVNPEHRDVTGWFFQRVYEHAPPVHLGMPNPVMYPFAKATGAVTDLDRLVDLRAGLDMRALLEFRGFAPALSALAGIAFRPVPKMVGWLARLRAARDISVRRLQAFDERFDALWNDVAGDYPGSMVRDYAYLSWRFDRCPERQYTRYVAERGGRVAGYMVTREQHLEGRRGGLIVDFLVPRHDPGVLHNLTRQALEDFAAAGAAAVSCPIATAQRELIRVLRWQGFWLTRHRAHVVAGRGPLLDSIVAVKDWFFTLADSDADYNHEA